MLLETHLKEYVASTACIWQKLEYYYTNKIKMYYILLLLCFLLIINFSYSFIPSKLSRTRIKSELNNIKPEELGEWLDNTGFMKFNDLLLRTGDKISSILKEENKEFTLFAPSSSAWSNLDSSIINKLRDPRNAEVVEKIILYHLVEGKLLQADIFEANGGSLITKGGDVAIRPSLSGGFLGIGAKEDGGITINGAKLVNTWEVDNIIIHEVDNLINPYLLYRFLDAVRLPGSK